MAEYADGVGAWGAWQVEPSKFTQLVVNSMRTLYVVCLVVTFFFFTCLLIIYVVKGAAVMVS